MKKTDIMFGVKPTKGEMKALDKFARIMKERGLI